MFGTAKVAVSAEVKITTGIDSWNLVYIILAFRSEIGDLTPINVGVSSYVIK